MATLPAALINSGMKPVGPVTETSSSGYRLRKRLLPPLLRDQQYLRED